MEFIDDEEYNINKFNISDIEENSHILIIGKGKNELCKNILYNFKHFTSTQIISPTERQEIFFSNFIINQLINLKYTDQLITEFLECQIIKKSKKDGQEKSIIVMNDCLNNMELSNSKDLGEILFNGKHYDITYVLTLPVSIQVPPELRGSFDYVFLFSQNHESSLKMFYKKYASIFPSFRSFSKTFKELTKNRGCMVIKNRCVHGQDINKTIFYYEEKINNEYFSMNTLSINNLKNDQSLNNLLEGSDESENTKIINYNTVKNNKILFYPFVMVVCFLFIYVTFFR